MTLSGLSARDDRSRRPRLAIVASHPIQYQAPLFRLLAERANVEVEVLFCSRWGVEPRLDPGFGATFAWDRPLLDGYPHRFLANWSPRPGPIGGGGLVNPGVFRALSSRRHDAVWINGWASATNWMAWAAARQARLPVLLRGESNGLREPTGPRRLVKRALLRPFFRHVAAFLTIGTLNRAFYLRHGVEERRLFPTPYGVDNDFFRAEATRLAPRRSALRAACGVDDGPVVLFSGKLVERKRPHDLVEACARLQSSAAITLAFAGDGPMRPRLEALARARGLERIRFLGFHNQGRIGEAYAMADVLALPSSFEPWGLVLNEAMCFGLPIVACDRVGAAHDLVEPGVNGFVHATGDVAGLVDALRRVVVDGNRTAMGEGSSRIVEAFGLDRAARGIEQAVGSVVAAGPAA